MGIYNRAPLNGIRGKSGLAQSIQSETTGPPAASAIDVRAGFEQPSSIFQGCGRV